MKNEDMTEGVLWKQLLTFAIPIFMSSVFQQLYNMIDIWFLGNFVGTNAIAATGGTTGTYINMTISLYSGFASAIAIIVGQYFGKNIKDRVGYVIQNAIIVCAGLGAVIGIICIFLITPILEACSVPDEIFELARSYLVIYFSGTILMFTYNMSTGILRAIGDARTPLMVLAGSCIVNIFLDGLFVVWFKWGVSGAAAATIVSQGVSALINLHILFVKKPEYRFKISNIHPDFMVIKNIIVIGLPCGIQNMLYSLANLILQSAVNRFGTATVAAMSIYSKADSICWWAVEAYGLALTTIVAQNYGAGNYKRIKKVTFMGIVFAFITETILATALYFGAEYYFGAFTDNSETVKAGIEIIRTTVPFFISYIFIDTLAGSMKGMGKTIGPMLITFMGICVVRIIWVMLISLNNGSFTLLLSNYPVTWIVTSTLSVIYYFHIYQKYLKGKK